MDYGQWLAGLTARRVLSYHPAQVNTGNNDGDVGDKMSVSYLRFFAWLVSMLIPALSLGADAIGRVASLEGTATGTTADGKTEKLAVDSPVYLNQRIATGAGSKIQIRFQDDSTVFQGERSEMTVDEYVYTPGEKPKNNCALGFVRGMFRVITGKIVDLNSDRFRVRTRMATIGIRGCEVGCLLYGKSEDVYILKIPEGKTIQVSALQGEGQAVDRVLNVIKEGVCISVFEGTGLLQRPLTIQEATQLIRESTPQGGGGRALELSKNVHGSLQEITDRVSTDTAKVTAQLIVDSGAGVLGSLVQGPREPPPASVTPPNPPPAPLVAMGSTPMSSPDWDWGIYADGSMAAIARQPVTAAEFQAIVSTAVPYNLNTPPGNGTAGAFLNYGGTRSLVQGSCSLNVQINVSPSSLAQWQGSFNMTSAKNSDFLGFSVPLGNGKIDPLTGQLSIPAFQGTTHTASYNMQVTGRSFSGASITGEGLTGQLVGPGSGAGAFTGVSGQFNFQHGSAASVNGVYGSDLR